MFWIGLTEEPLIEMEPGEQGRVGLLVLGGYEERFVAHTYTWSEHDYVSQWSAALVRALAGKASALVTDMLKPAESSHLVWWPMWRINARIVFHNQLLFFEQHGIGGPSVDIEQLYGLIGKLESHGGGGEPLSEWTVPVPDIDTFLKSSAERASV